MILLFGKLKLDDANVDYLTSHREALGIATPTDTDRRRRCRPSPCTAR